MRSLRSGLSASVVALVVSVILCGAAGAAPPPPFTFVDTLGAATPETVFPLAGTGGISLSPDQWAGPQFTVTKHSTIAEIGAFIAGSSTGVQIRPSVDGVPDSTVVIADLSLPTCPADVVCYVSVAPEKNLKVRLKPGVYFALFTATPDASGYLLASASLYHAGEATFGFLDPTTGVASANGNVAAVRVLGK